MTLYSQLQSDFEVRLQAFAAATYADESSALHKACRYALAGAGKRVRPLLLLLTERACGAAVNSEAAYAAAIAVEIAHTYSLVHDDMPLCDNDSLRRGRPTVHVVFSEVMALLAGDALLADSFQAFALSGLGPLALQEFARALGAQGMTLGQAIDMTESPQTESALAHLHSLKTGALLSVSCVLGALAAQASAADCERLRRFGLAVGLAFQIIDDSLDESVGTGKSPGKDRAQQKTSYLTLFGAEGARALAQEKTEAALRELFDMENGADKSALVDYVLALMERKL